MFKPNSFEGYKNERTLDCERLLLTLLRGLGPWKDSVFLIGGLVPRYIVKQRPPDVPPHAGTQDVDLVLDLQILANTDAYRTLEQNLKKLGFERSTTEEGLKLSWRWQTRTETGVVVTLEFLADDPERAGGRVQALPAKGNVSALNIPHSSIVFDLYDKTEIRGELLDGGGIATVEIRHANLVSFICLKAFAYEDRHERKDAHDLIYCLENAPGGFEAAVVALREAAAGKHGEVIANALAILKNRFGSDEETEGYKKDGPTAIGNFETGDQTDVREQRILRQRNVADFIDRLLAALKQQSFHHISDS